MSAKQAQTPTAPNPTAPIETPDTKADTMLAACCPEPTLSAISEAHAATLAAAFAAIADPARVRLLSLIANASAGEVCACDLVEPLGKSQPTVSHHLKILTDAGLVDREKRGIWAWYRINPDRVAAVAQSFGAIASPGNAPSA